MSLHDKYATKILLNGVARNQTNRDGVNKEETTNTVKTDRDGEDHNFRFIAIRHTQHLRPKSSEPRSSDIIMTKKEKQQTPTKKLQDSKQTRSVHITNS